MLPAISSRLFYGSLLLQATAFGQSGIFTVQVGTPPPPPTPLVRYNDTWHIHKGTNAPTSGWRTNADATLDSTWASRQGGFGYATDNPNETIRCATILNDMFNGYTNLYIRRTFQVTDAPDPSRRLVLTMDWDDGFVAYLDGTEVARFNAPGAVGTEIANSASATASHESSNGNPPQPPMTFDLGAVGSRLAPGPHVLAIIGLNRPGSSTDFILIADLQLTGGAAGVAQDGYFALVKTNSVILSGTNTFPNSARVVVNGLEADFNIGSGVWSRTHPLEPNMNRLFIAALDAQGRILASTNKDIVAELSTLSIGGPVGGDTGIGASNSVVRLTSDVIIRPGERLSLGENSIVLIPPNMSIRVQTNGELRTFGLPHRPVLFLPADGSTPWREISATGVNAALNLSHAEIVAGEVRAVNGGAALLEDCVVRDATTLPAREVIAGVNGASLTLRRTHVLRFAEVDATETPFLAEDCLFERMFVDALDVKSTTTNAPLLVRRSTMRHGVVRSGEPDVDGVDFGPGIAPVVDSCLIHDFDDKGVSIADNAHGTVVRNSVIYNCGFAGVSAYASTNLVVSQNTISLCSTGLTLRNNPGPAYVAGTNNILWGNTVQIAVFGTSSNRLAYSDVQGGAPGEGNIDSDPLFVNLAARDFRLSAGSPAFGTGFGGANMGATFPVGGIPPAPFSLAAVVNGTNPIQLEWQEDAGNENAFVIERSPNGIGWGYLGAAQPNSTTYVDTEAAVGQRYFYRVRAENSSGISRWSNIASGTRAVPTTHVGGTLAQNAVWSPALGNIVVTSNLTVPAGISLTMLPGTTVFVTNNASIIATAGGTILINGEADNRVTIAPRVPGSIWLELSARGSGTSLTLRHAEISGGQTTVNTGASGLLEDSYFHDYRSGSSPIVLTSFASSMTVRRCHFREYYETLFRDGVITVEDCLFEYMSGDALDFDGAQPGTVLRRSTFRHGIRAPSNIDAVDIGPGNLGACRDVVIEDCLMFNFPTDKGVSIGDAPDRATGTVVRNCLIEGCLSGVQVKDSCFAEVYNCTFVNNRWALTNYNKLNTSAPTGGGHTTNAHNNIVWNNEVSISMWNGGTLTADHCNFGNTNWPGEGNINLDPQFVNAALRDYRLGPNSPCRGTGRDGADMGARFPVGSRMAPSHASFESMQISGNEVVLRFWADNEKDYTIEASSNLAGNVWTPVAAVPGPTLPKLTEVRSSLQGQNRFYRIASVPIP